MLIGVILRVRDILALAEKLSQDNVSPKSEVQILVQTVDPRTGAPKKSVTVGTVTGDEILDTLEYRGCHVDVPEQHLTDFPNERNL